MLSSIQYLVGTKEGRINFDGSVVSSTSRRGAGFVVRGHDDKLVRAEESVPLFDVSVPLAEMVAAWNAIKVAIFCIGVKNLWIEGDTLGICMAIR